MKTIKISIDEPYIDPDSDLELDSVHYQANKIPDFSDTDSLLVDEVKDEGNLLEYRFDYDMQPNENIYVRTKYKFNNDLESNWSKVISVNRDQVGLKLSGMIVNTPKTTYTLNVDSTGEYLEFVTSSFSMYGGLGKHKSTSRILTDLDGNVIYKRERDEDNLLTFKLPVDKLDKTKSYIMLTKHITDTNVESHYGRTIISFTNDNYHLFELIDKFPLVSKRFWWAELRVYTPEYESIDIMIEALDGTIVDELLDQNTMYPYIYTEHVVPGNVYTIKARINLVGKPKGPYSIYKSYLARPNTLVNYANIKYLNKYTYMNQMLTNGKTLQTTSESYSGTVFLSKNKDSKLYSYKIRDGKLAERGSVIRFEEEDKVFDKLVLNTINLHNGNILLDYAGDLEDGTYRKPTFKYYEYNHSSGIFRLISSLERTDERYSTAISRSSASFNNDKVYYIPAEIVNDDGENEHLVLRSYNLKTNEVHDVSRLPVDIKRFGSIVELNDEELLFMGGVEDISAYNSEFLRDNDKIYKFNIVTNMWTELGSLEDIIPNEVYNLHLVKRRDGKVGIFNATEYGPGAGNQDTYIYDALTNAVTTISSDIDDDLPYTNTIIMRTGDVVRISGRVKDPQKIIRYISNTTREEDIVDNNDVDVVTELVVDVNTIVTIENPYRFEKITILGNDDDDTGLLRWIDGDNLREFRYKDLIITRPTDSDDIDEDEYDTITVIEGGAIIDDDDDDDDE